jgi:hypothetical protein
MIWALDHKLLSYNISYNTKTGKKEEKKQVIAKTPSNIRYSAPYLALPVLNHFLDVQSVRLASPSAQLYVHIWHAGLQDPQVLEGQDPRGG